MSIRNIALLQQRAFAKAADILERVADTDLFPIDLTAEEENWMREYIRTMIASLVRNHMLRGAPKKKVIAK